MLRFLRRPSVLLRFAVASVVANVVIVVTGGAVRLTDSGLGCPTWPNCGGGRLTPEPESGFHVYVEFGNRMLTFVLVAIAIGTWLAAMAQRRERRLATFAALGIPAQAVLGGLTVLTHLNPWLVAAHFLLSSVIIAITFALFWRVRPDGAVPAADTRVRLLARLTTAAAAITLMIGTVVTGSGPHAGDLTSGRVRRTGLSPASMSQLHADSVMVLIGLSVGLLVLVHVLKAHAAVRRAAAILVAVELAQGGVGYAQYFLHLPELLVGIHMLGACLVWLAALQVLLLSEPAARRSARPVPA
ncbi:COX15/CtaA family protein [Jatrophihabitans fulvus]